MSSNMRYVIAIAAAVMALAAAQSECAALYQGKRRAHGGPAARAVHTNKPTVKAPPPAPGASITHAADTVVIRNGRRLAAVKAGTRLLPGDVLKTGPHGNVDLRIADQAAVRLKPSSSLRLQQVLQRTKAEPAVPQTRLRLDLGTALAKLRALMGRSRFNLDAPSQTTAARGTSWLVTTAGGTTTVLVHDGVVEVALTGKPKQQLLIAADQKATVARELPAAAQAQDDQDKERLKEVEDLQLTVDHDTDQLINQADLLLDRRLYAQALSVAELASERGYGRANGVRATARIAEALRKGSGTYSGFGPNREVDYLTWLNAGGPAGFDLATYRMLPDGPDRWRMELSACVESFRSDPIALRWLLVALMWRAAPFTPLATLAQVSSELKAYAPQDIEVRDHVDYALAWAILDNPTGSPDTAEQNERAGEVLTRLMKDPNADVADRINAVARLAVHPKIPPPLRIDVQYSGRMYLQLGAGRADETSIYYAGQAYARIGRFAEAERLIRRYYGLPWISRQVASGKAHFWLGEPAVTLADGYASAGNRAGERRWLRYYMAHFASSPEAHPDLTAHVRDRLKVLGP